MDVQIFVETTFDDGSTQRREIARLDRTPDNSATETLGLRLDEAKNFLTRLLEVLLCNQIVEVLAASRICDDCGKRRAIHDDRGRTLDTLYGRFRVKAPRLRQCACKLDTGAAKVVLLSPLNVMFPDGATPEFQRLQAELGSRHSFREAARLLEIFLPCAPQSNTTVRNRLGRIAEKLDVAAEGHGDKNARATSSPLTVFLDGAHIRCRPEYQKRHLDVVVGKVENANMSRRFGLVQQAARSPAKQLRHDLIAQGWDGQSKVIVISDGEPALPNLVRCAVQGPVTHILDWWHISMRVQHIENAVRGLLQTKGFSGLPQLFERPAETLRWYLWHGRVMTTATILKVLEIDCNRLSAETKDLREAARRVKARCQELYSYLSNNFDALVNYGHRYRNGLAVSSSRAEGCVDDIGNTRMGKQRRMRWSPQGAHRVAVTRAAVLDGRLTVSKIAA
ncbi:ISKra4 family transposase [Cypionkella sp.]|uniref:ISKra4 family transposase n=1 Tax=Cypionkella sp. TaxID=2811411 RepID=UPI002AB95593|nr:ISKra4 family transposase [Cypionkella sp.]MDZ4392515.1 ISKra4 family transposase [Cypionkella sp.]